MKRFGTAVLLLVGLIFMLSGCDGGSSPTVSGVAAAGSPLAGTVYMKDSSNPAQELSAPIGADGSFFFNVGGLTAPFVLKGAGTANGESFTLYSFASSPGIANINPLSHLAVAEANGSDDLAALYAGTDPERMRAVNTGLAKATIRLQAALQPLLSRFEASGINFISDPYAADHRRLDLLLDLISVSTSNATVTFTDRTTGNTAQTSINGLVAGSIDLIPDVPPHATGSVLVYPMNSSVIANGTVNFRAIVAGTQGQQVTWSVVERDGGSITNAGVYTAPATAGTYHIMATSAADGTKSATAAVTVRSPNTITVSRPGQPGLFVVTGNELTGVAGMHLTITYDPQSLTNPRVQQGELPAHSLFIANPALPGTLQIVMITDSPISGTRPLVTIFFDEVESSPASTPIQLSSVFLVDYDALPIISPPVPETVTIAGVVLGDLNGNTLVQIDDALLLFQIALGKRIIQPGELHSGDVAPMVNGIPAPDGRIDLGDVIVLMRRVVGLLSW